MKEFFLGRKKELAKIQTMLKKYKIVFLSGMGGVGKSEIAKQYARQYETEHRSIFYLTYDGSLETMILSERGIQITYFQRFFGETEQAFCNRKLRKMKELLKETDLIIMDNLDVFPDQTEEKTIWREVISLPCHFLITTRCDQREYPQLKIKNIEEMDCLKRIFKHYCPYQPEEERNVETLIKQVKCHVLLTELLAKQAKAAFLTPKELLQKIQQNRWEISQDKVALLKDGTVTFETMNEHVKQLFFLETMKNEEKIVLAEAALMSLEGVEVSVFFSFFDLKDHNDLNGLIQKGWIYEKDRMIVMHPLIVEVLLEEIKNQKELLKIFYERIQQAAKKTYQMLKTEETIFLKKSFVDLCDEIAWHIKLYQFQEKEAGNFLYEYLRNLKNNGGIQKKSEIAEYMIREICEKNKEAQTSEHVYELYSNLLIKSHKFQKAYDLSSKHLSLAKKQKNSFLMACWNVNLQKIAILRGEHYVKCLFRMEKILLHFIKCRKEMEQKQELWSHLIEVDEIFADRIPKNFGEKVVHRACLWESLLFRKYFFKESKLKEQLNKAEIYFYFQKYDQAKELLQQMIEEKEAFVSDAESLHKVHKLLGKMAEKESDKEKAKKEFLLCRELERTKNLLKDEEIERWFLENS